MVQENDGNEQRTSTTPRRLFTTAMFRILIFHSSLICSCMRHTRYMSTLTSNSYRYIIRRISLYHAIWYSYWLSGMLLIITGYYYSQQYIDWLYLVIFSQTNIVYFIIVHKQVMVHIFDISYFCTYWNMMSCTAPALRRAFLVNVYTCIGDCLQKQTDSVPINAWKKMPEQE